MPIKSFSFGALPSSTVVRGDSGGALALDPARDLSSSQTSDLDPSPAIFATVCLTVTFLIGSVLLTVNNRTDFWLTAASIYDLNELIASCVLIATGCGY
jgi:hypothetical protein